MCLPLHFKRLPMLAWLAVCAVPCCAAQDVFELGTVTVQGRNLADSSDESSVSRQAMEAYNHDTVSAAVVAQPGMNVSRNSRNEDIVYLRGFDVRQVPLFMDGVPTYVPYDGYVDFGRFTTFDLSEIRIAKGAASLLYGPNALGGAINLVTRKPTRSFEGDLRLGFGSGGERRTAVNLGGKHTQWYYQIGASYLGADSFALSKDFVATAAQGAGNRNNAYRKDQKLSFKLGLTPNASDEFAIGYVQQDGEKGNPPYAGTAPGGIRYWRWPYWNVQSLYAAGKMALGENHVLTLRVYNDTYRNGIDAYTNASFTTQINNTSFPSRYNDSSRGLSAELASGWLANHELRLAYHYKQDRHNEWNPNIADKNFRDVTSSLALEDTVALSSAWRLRMGLSHDWRDTQQAATYALGKTRRSNALVELTHSAGDTEVYVSIAQKSRFPTIKDRYSFRLGQALSNPDLRPESALNLELGVKAQPWTGAAVQASLFHSRIKDLMQAVVVPAPGSCPNGPKPNVTCNQLQNVGTARHQGIELSMQQQLGPQWRAVGAYTYLDRVNLSNPAVPLTDTPTHHLFASINWTPVAHWDIQGTLEAESGRWVPYGNAYKRTGGFARVGLKAGWAPRPDVQVELGVTNLFDKNYEFADGYPMPGRSLFANLKYRF